MAGKSLGTLTIDLIAKVGGFVQGMDKAERASQKWRDQVKKRRERGKFCNNCRRRSRSYSSSWHWCRRVSNCQKYSAAGNRS